MVTVPANHLTLKGFHLNCPPASFQPQRDLPEGFLEFLEHLHRRFTPWQRSLLQERARVLRDSLEGEKPSHRFPAEAVRNGWCIELPDWCQDQRNQVTGPADKAELVVEMLNAGAPGVVLDMEDSVVNEWDRQRLAVENILQALRGTLTVRDDKHAARVGIQAGKTVIWTRPRGLHISQGGIFPNELTSASLFDVASIAFQVNPAELKHPLSFYIPKSESADEALWWRDLFQAISAARGWPKNYIKCMALVESHPLAFQMEEFLYNLRGHVLGLRFGSWDYMASLVQFNYEDPNWVLPDRNTIPHNIPFFHNLRELLPEICHKRGIFAIGGNSKNDADCLMDGAWTSHPDQKEITLDQFPYPNQLHKRRPHTERYPDLRPVPEEVGERTLNGTRAAVRSVIRYRNGVLNGKGASRLDGSMEDLATDRLYRLMIAQRMRHSEQAPIRDGSGFPVEHTPELISEIFDEQLEMLIANPGCAHVGSPETLAEARRVSEAMIVNDEFDPI